MTTNDDTKPTPDRTPTDLDQYVFEWAAINSISSAQAIAVYDSWREQGMTNWTDVSLRHALSNYFLHIREVEAASTHNKVHFESQRSSWGLEAIKHIALINLAGVAGILTLQSTDKAKSSLFWPLALFICGALTSVITLLVAASMYGRRAELEDARANDARVASSWEELAQASHAYIKGLPPISKMYAASVISIVLSLALTFLGTIALAWVQF